MKKILTVSLVAMMAVSAARAEIASVQYVTNNYTTTEGMTSAISTAKSEAIAASDAKGSAAQALTDAKAYTDAEIGAIGDTTVKAYVDTAVDDAVGALSDSGGAIAALGTRVGTAEGEIDALQASLAAGGATATAIAEAKQAGTDAASALDTYKTTVTNTLKEYSTTAQMNTAITNNAVNTVATGAGNGTIAVDGTDVAVKGLGTAAYTNTTAYDAAGSAAAAQAAAIAASDTKGSAAQALADAKTYTDTKIGTLTDGYTNVVAYVDGKVADVDGDLGGLQGTVDDHTSQIEALDSKLGNVEATANAAVVANTAITAGTATKITYDAKGLVTKGENLTSSDIPEIPQSKVAGLTDALNNKQAKAGANPYQIVKEDGTWATLTYGLPENCKGAGVVCSLISTNGVVGWEVVAK